MFLDKKHRLYSCAYWKEGTKTLEEAQQNKIDHIIKKLDIKEGEKILEVGCGWGGMAFEIARQKGCEITGISLSKNQIEFCKKKAKELGTNARGLRNILDTLLLPYQFDAAEMAKKGVTKITITEQCVDKGADPVLLFKKQHGIPKKQTS